LGPARLEPRVVLVVQARMSSQRLSRKVLANIASRAALEWVLLRASRAVRVAEARLAIPDGPGNDPLAKLAEKLNCPCTRGSEPDCLDRYLQAARESEAEHIVRVSGDSPFIDPEMIDAAVDAHLASGADYSRNFEPIDIPAGLCVEAVTRKALERAASESTDPYDREHVTPYFYREPGRFTVMRTPVPEKLLRPDLRLTLDTPDDLEVLREIASRFPGRDDFSALEIVELLDANPQIKAINSAVEQRAMARAAFWIDCGHLTRARALAAALAVRGIRCRFYCRAEEVPAGDDADARLVKLTPADGRSFAQEFAEAARQFGAGCVVLAEEDTTREDAQALSTAGLSVAVVGDLCRPEDTERAAARIAGMLGAQ
jgi:spore coat polysaccharide biosynthesis protein SpsF